MYTKFSNFTRFKIIVCLISLLFLSQKVCAEEAEELRQEVLALEKVVNPFVRIFQKVSRLVAPSVVSIVAEDAYGTSNKPSFGSGIIIKNPGYILTNCHVIEGFENGRITVTLYNGDKYGAAIVGKDANTDLAILKITCDTLREAILGDPKSVKVG